MAGARAFLVSLCALTHVLSIGCRAVLGAEELPLADREPSLDAGDDAFDASPDADQSDLDADAEASAAVLKVACTLNAPSKRRLLSTQGDPGGGTTINSVSVFAGVSQVRVFVYGSGDVGSKVISLVPGFPGQDLVESVPWPLALRAAVRRGPDRLTFAVFGSELDAGSDPIALYDLVDGTNLSDWAALGWLVPSSSFSYDQSDLSIGSREDGNIDFLLQGHRASPATSELFAGRWSGSPAEPTLVDSSDSVKAWQADKPLVLPSATHWFIRSPAGLQQLIVRNPADAGLTHEVLLHPNIETVLAGETSKGDVAVVALDGAFNALLGRVGADAFATFEPDTLLSVPATDARIAKVAPEVMWYDDQLVGFGPAGMTLSQTLSYYWLDVAGELRGDGALTQAQPGAKVRAGKSALLASRAGGGDFAVAWIEVVESDAGAYEDLWFASVSCAPDLTGGEP